MQHKESAKKIRYHFKSFAPLTIVAILGAVVSGMIIQAAFDSITQDQINSLSVVRHRVFPESKNLEAGRQGGEATAQAPIKK